MVQTFTNLIESALRVNTSPTTLNYKEFNVKV